MTNFIPKIIEIKGIDPESAFLDAQREARHVYGNNGTTGTIADADGHIIVSGPALLYWDARRASQQLIRDGHAKAGGPAFILRLADPAKTRQVKVAVDITGRSPGHADDAVDEALREKLPDDQWGIHSVELRYSNADGDDRKGVTKTKTLITTGKGARLTKYSVRNAGNNVELVAHPSLAEAKTWMKEALAAGSAPMYVVAEVGKESGPLLSGETQVLKQTVVAVATIGIPAPGGNSSYLAAGIYPTSA